MPNLELINKLWKQTEIKDKCWLWKGTLDTRGYGLIDGMRTHRLSLCIYLKLKYNDTWVTCHICNNKECWNPLHIYPGTPKDNTRDMVASGKHTSVFKRSKTHCVNGHEYTPENTYIKPNGARNCKLCLYKAGRKHRA